MVLEAHEGKREGRGKESWKAKKQKVQERNTALN